MKRRPPYAYVPGHRPHPTRSGSGHSSGTAAPIPEPMEPDAWRDCVPYLEGIELFNAGYYWEAHEAWEGLWVAAGRAGAMGELFHGLIKLSVAGLKVCDGRRRKCAHGKAPSRQQRFLGDLDSYAKQLRVHDPSTALSVE